MSSNSPVVQGNLHDVISVTNAIKDRERRAAESFGERNFIGKRANNVSGVAAGGALQLRRLGGTVNTGIVGS